MKEGVYRTIREFEANLMPNAILDRLVRDWRVINGWEVKLHRHKEDKRFTDKKSDRKSGQIEVWGVEEERIWAELEYFYTLEGYKVKFENGKFHGLELSKEHPISKKKDKYWAVVMGTSEKVDVYIFRSPMIRIEESHRVKALGLVGAK